MDLFGCGRIHLFLFPLQPAILTPMQRENGVTAETERNTNVCAKMHADKSHLPPWVPGEGEMAV